MILQHILSSNVIHSVDIILTWMPVHVCALTLPCCDCPKRRHSFQLSEKRGPITQGLKRLPLAFTNQPASFHLFFSLSVFRSIHSYSRNNNSHLFHRFPSQPQSHSFQIIPLDSVTVMTLLMPDPPEPLWERELGSPDQTTFTLLGTWLCKLPTGLPSPSSTKTEYK